MSTGRILVLQVKEADERARSTFNVLDWAVNMTRFALDEIYSRSNITSHHRLQLLLRPRQLLRLQLLRLKRLPRQRLQQLLRARQQIPRVKVVLVLFKDHLMDS